jgi:hypothetical protein
LNECEYHIPSNPFQPFSPCYEEDILINIREAMAVGKRNGKLRQ